MLCIPVEVLLWMRQCDRCCEKALRNEVLVNVSLQSAERLVWQRAPVAGAIFGVVVAKEQEESAHRQTALARGGEHHPLLREAQWAAQLAGLRKLQSLAHHANTLTIELHGCPRAQPQRLQHESICLIVDCGSHCTGESM